MSQELKSLTTKQLLEQEQEWKQGEILEQEENKKTELREYRCPVCYKLFFRAQIISALIEVKCRNCKKVARIKSLGF